MEVRLATMSDVKSMSVLITQLGYPTSVKQMERRFDRIKAHGDYRTWLAVINGEVVGMIGAVKVTFMKKTVSTYELSHLSLMKNTEDKALVRGLCKSRRNGQPE